MKSARIVLSKYLCESITGTVEGKFLRKRSSFPESRGSARRGEFSDGREVFSSDLEVVLGLGREKRSRYTTFAAPSARYSTTMEESRSRVRMLVVEVMIGGLG